MALFWDKSASCRQSVDSSRMAACGEAGWIDEPRLWDYVFQQTREFAAQLALPELAQVAVQNKASSIFSPNVFWEEP